MITTIFNTVTNSVAYPIYYGLLGLIAVVAVIMFIVNALRGLFDPTDEKHSLWMRRAGYIMFIVILAGIAAPLINWLLGITGFQNISGVQ